jgi:tRNA(fMet)-specific endonuclease VapC
VLRYILDPDLCIRVLRDRPPRLRDRFNAEATALCISSVTQAELLNCAERSGRPVEGRQRVESFAARLEVLPFDREAAAHYADIRADLERRGEVIGPYDRTIAGHAAAMSSSWSRTICASSPGLPGCARRTGRRKVEIGKRTNGAGVALKRTSVRRTFRLEERMSNAARRDHRARAARLGFRVDGETKALIERAAELERRKVTDFCTAALTEAARRTIAEHETLVLSERDRAAFFEALLHPPAPSERLRRAFAEHGRRVEQ